MPIGKPTVLRPSARRPLRVAQHRFDGAGLETRPWWRRGRGGPGGVRQPGDGSCLFHSLAYGLGGGYRARALRRQIANFIRQNPDLDIADSPLRDWIKWESNTSVSTYASRMAVGGWGGGIEMAACSRLISCNIHVYEKGGYFSSGFKRISCFDMPGATKTVHILYGGRVHYDALQVR